MKCVLFISLLLPLMFSCSNEKKERDAFLLKITTENGVLQQKQSKLISTSTDELNRFNKYIMDMKLAGASKTVIDSLENDKKQVLESYNKKLKEVEMELNSNSKKVDSIIASNK